MALSRLSDGLTIYTEYIKTNPLIATEIESALRWVSYFFSGRFKNSHVISELLYSSANLLQVFNDLLLQNAANVKLFANHIVEKLQIFLTVLEYTEVFSEFSGDRLAGEVGKWIIITIIQITKAVIKLILLLKFNQGIQRHIPIVPVNRRALTALRSNSGNNNVSDEVPSTSSEHARNGVTIKLKRSGRVMRSLDGAPPRSKRTWTLNQSCSNGINNVMDMNRKHMPPTNLNDQQIIGELLHILRPIAQLSTMYAFGVKAWTPFVVSLGMDLTSIRILNNSSTMKWNVNEKLELGQRTFSLVLYLMRSPFFDKYTKQRFIRILSIGADNIPLLGRLIRPLVDYLPEWQKTYFYVWGV